MKKIAIFLAIIIFNSFLCGCLNKEEDSDGDGLKDEKEKEGWEIRVVYPEEKNVTIYHVTSNPDKIDTDGDNLTDLEEFLYPGGKATDPNKRDTDGDGLTDFEEKNLGTDPTNWKHDIDEDGFIDYYEILFYEERNITHEKIMEYIQDRDVDNDGAIDGMDFDPLRDLKIKVWIKNIMIQSDMGDKDDMIEVEINVSVGKEWKKFYLPVIPYLNETLNFTCILDLDDVGEPGNASHPLMIIAKDLDEGVEKKIIDPEDGFPQYDFIKVFEGNEWIYSANFNIFTDCHSYHGFGVDGEIWFEIIDVSE
ncbi:MAG TPA: hypothetical protein ENI53_01850 [Thermoplasmatales archaeon]|nr:hypothetical protein [Thermoplasmatales archaeon]